MFTTRTEPEHENQDLISQTNVVSIYLLQNIVLQLSSDTKRCSK